MWFAVGCFELIVFLFVYQGLSKMIGAKGQAAAAAVIVCVLAFFPISMLTTSIPGWFAPTPDSLEEAGLIGDRRWTDEQMALAAKVSSRQMQLIDNTLQELSRKGDSVGAVGLFKPVIGVVSAWNDQAAKRDLGRYRNCQLAAAHLADGLASVGQGGAYLSASRFQASIADCR